ncbi:tRNA (adenosine(37)-N6)-dimethylallyltransferase MiaA [Aurantibacillus circumpalustris]|uniref:tRNA (adenosine(37)-N6)-dimethylallyltransferase MiaA n=1 Tax=Aurantibacillus circumpalustris TaxID=3036359 RepID=UPI00295BEF93|nr:tRNA (adenosine(37)-N6)-dimethylallyltransferase MiaA [Aurantibacillus circumpalustris]
MNKYNCIIVLGPTASGKTRLACHLAYELDGEIISADSRQVYKSLNIGTGKDLNEYVINEKSIPYHIIDIIEPQEQFYLHQFGLELKKAFELITAKSKIPIICGGTGLYLDAVRKDFSFTQIKENEKLRSELEFIDKEELVALIKTYPEQFMQHVDLNSKKRIIRGIEIAEHFSKSGNTLSKVSLPYKPYYIGITTEVKSRKKHITERLHKRLEEGLIQEVENLLSKGITHERLELFGLEYKFVSRYLKKEISKEELFVQLQTAIFQYSKRQMTWFRKMEKEGVEINWIQKDEDVFPRLSTLFK